MKLRVCGCVLAILVGSVACHRPPPAVLNQDLVLPSKPSGAKSQVIFVHGVTGDPVTTYGTADLNWPTILAHDPEFGTHTDVMSVGYESNAISATSNINEIATRLLNRLIDNGVFDRHDRIAFVVHSMGGLIVKRMLVQLRSDRPDLYQRVAGVVFLATPSGGSSLAETARWISNNPQFEDMKPEDMNTFLQLIEDDWQQLLRSRTEQAPYPMAYCVYETKPMGPVTVVPRSRAQTGCDERSVAFDRNHSTLVKPASRSDDVYLYVAARLKRILAPPPLPPMTMEAYVLGPGDQPLPENPTLPSGSAFAISISTSRPAWFYVVAQDSTGKAQRYFPSPLAGQQVAPTTSLRIPSNPTLTLVLDKNTGLERIHVFASDDKSAELEQLVSGVEALSTKAATKKLDWAVSTRGAHVAPVVTAQSTSALNPTDMRADVAKTLLIEHR